MELLPVQVIHNLLPFLALPHSVEKVKEGSVLNKLKRWTETQKSGLCLFLTCFLSVSMLSASPVPSAS